MREIGVKSLISGATGIPLRVADRLFSMSWTSLSIPTRFFARLPKKMSGDDRPAIAFDEPRIGASVAFVNHLFGGP
jgi:hypothetical protein